jgi:hypothetical protein
MDRSTAILKLFLPIGSMKSLVLAFTGLFLGFASSFGATAEVQWGTLDFTNGFGTADGTPLPVGDIALVGSFNITPAQITANGGNESFLMSHFITFGIAHIGDGFIDPFRPGYFVGDSTADSNGLGINNAQIYYWVFNSTAAATATQYGIFTDPTGANANSGNWRFPDTGSVTPITVTDISDVPQDASGILWGGYGVGTSSGPDADPLYNLASFAAVPEPSSFALFGLGAVGLALIRRRAKR